MVRLVGLIVVAMLLGGCSTHPVSSGNAIPLPPDRVFAFQSPTGAPSGTLVVTRDQGMQGRGCHAAFYIDGQLAAHVRAGETATLSVPAGNRIVGVGPAGKGLCTLANPATHRRETSLVIEANSQIKVRLSIVGEGVYQVTPTAF